MLRIDGAVDKLVRQVFTKMQNVSRREIIQGRYQNRMAERKSLLQAAQADYSKAEQELALLKIEVLKAIQGTSAFSKELLAGMIGDGEEKCASLLKRKEDAEAAYHQSNKLLQELERQYDNSIAMAEMYDTASLEAKKMILPEFQEFFQQPNLERAKIA